MTIALNLFFWDDWLGISSTDEETDHGSGGGKKNKPPKRVKLYSDDFHQLDQDFWDQREEYLRATLKVIEPPAVIHEQDDRQAIDEALAKFNEERSALIIQLRSSPDLATMKARGERLNQINSEITRLLGKKAVSSIKH